MEYIAFERRCVEDRGDTFLDGELFVAFLVESMRESLSSKIRNIESVLARPNGEKDHDSGENMKIE